MNSRSISKILSEARIVDRFKGIITTIEFGDVVGSPYADVYTNIEQYPDDRIEVRDGDFVQTVLKYITQNKDAEREIDVSDYQTLFIYQNNEGILAESTQPASDVQLTYNFIYYPTNDWKMTLSRCLFKNPLADKIMQKWHKDFLDSYNFFQINIGNYSKIAAENSEKNKKDKS